MIIQTLLAGMTLMLHGAHASLPIDSAGKDSTHLQQKECYIPSKVWKVPENNDYNNIESEYSHQRSAQSANLAIFWSKKFGDDPMSNPDSSKRFDTAQILKQCERFYDFYVDSLRFVERGHSVTDRYKILFYVFGEEDGTAYGGGVGDTIGMLWAPPARIHKAPYGAIAHELGHSFQYLVHGDGSKAFTKAPKGSRGQSIYEMTSQYMLWQVYPEWINFENYHLQAFLKQTHYAFLHEINQYHSPFVLEYWSDKHGKDFVGKIWREGLVEEDAVMAYKRLAGVDQQQFNDEIFDAARRFITWDIPRVEQVSRPYANQHSTKLDSVGSGRYRIAESHCPQNYGYNGIALQVPAAGTTVNLRFKGIAGAEGYRAIETDKAGWRYGFLAVRQDGSRVYGDMGSKSNGKIKFKVPKDTAYLWLVVSGAPTEHRVHLIDGNDENDEQWPYEIKLSGTGLKQ